MHLNHSTPPPFALMGGGRFLPWLVVMVIALTGWAQAQVPPKYIEGDVIVTFKAGASLDSAKASLKKKSMTFAKHFAGLSAKRQKHTGLVHDGVKTTQQLIAELKNDPSVETAEPNYLRYIKSVPNDTRFAEQWPLKNTGQAVSGITGTAGADVKYLEAWAASRDAAGELVVAVLDTGIDLLHPDLVANIWTNPQEVAGNGKDDDADGYIDDVHGYDFASNDADPTDAADHGTHVSGTIAAVGNNSQGVTGIMDRAKIMPLKVSDNGTTISTSAVILALQYVTAMKNRGVNVVAINASYGGSGSSTAESAAFLAAGNAGIIACVAAGNETTNNDTTPTYPAGYRLANMIVVAATDQNDALASYSNFGATTVDMAAPGSNVLSTKPSGVAFTAGGTSYTASEMAFSPRTTGLSGTLVSCGIGNPNEFPPAVNGNIAFIQRGTLTFAVKVANAKAAGAIAAVVYNNVAGTFSGTLQNAGDWIPALAISQADGQAIAAGLPMMGVLSLAPGYQFLDGTSMATPHVAGAVAFAAMCFPNETMTQRRQRVLHAVDSKANLAGKMTTGGRLNLLHIIDGGVGGVIPWATVSTPDSLVSAVVGIPYETTLEGAGGTVPYTFAVTAGGLPDGITMSSGGVISGTPTHAGTSIFTVTPSDAGGVGSGKKFTLVTAALPVTVTTDGALTGGIAGSAYTASLSADGGTAPYQWTVLSGNLPSGITLGADGALSGLPTSAGASNFAAKVTDSHGLTASRQFLLVVDPSPITVGTPASLPGAVRTVPYSQLLSASGGTAPYVWTLVSGVLPGGISLNSSGALSGTPNATALTQANFVLRVADAAGHSFTKAFTLKVTPTYVAPVMDVINLPATTVGVLYAGNVKATNYPKTYSIIGLPKGLTYSTATGAITGHATVGGVFTIQVKAANAGGTSAIVTAQLSVAALDKGMIGTFMGYSTRDALANTSLGSRLDITTSAVGTYSVRLTSGAVAKGAVGYLSATAPQLVAVVGNATLSLTFDAAGNLVSGTHGGATVTGWRQTWSATANSAVKRAGYYSIGLDLADAGDKGSSSIPQGSGYAVFTVTTAGTLTVSGRTADGQPIATAGFIGPSGELLVYQSLYANLGSVGGTLMLDLDPGQQISENTVSGSLTWKKPKNTSRAYGDGFGPVNVKAYGKYLAILPSGHIVMGLPSVGTASLLFHDGGLALSVTKPDVTDVTYSAAYVAGLPAVGTVGNPGKASLVINRFTGAITGAFTLVEKTPALTRTVAYAGIIVRQATGGVKAEGYFLEPQIPLTGQTITTSPILSGRVTVEQ